MLWKMGIALRILFLSLLLLFESCNTNSLESYSAKPLIVLTFDDCRESIYSLAFQEMKLYGFPGVNYFPVSWLEISGYLTLKNLHEMEKAGWESGGHSITHPDLTVIQTDSAHSEIRKNYQFLVNNGLMHNSFALPAGRTNSEIDKVILKYFSIIRTSINERYHYPLDIKRLGYYQVENNDNVNSLLARISRGVIEGESLIILGFHIFTDKDPTYPTTMRISEFKKFLKEISKKKLKVVTLTEAVKLLQK